MATHGSNHSEEPGQYPTTAWNQFGLPEQNFGSGAPGSAAPSSTVDQGTTNEPGQYPDRDDFTGVTYSLGGAAGTGAPGSAGVGADSQGGPGGPDRVTYSKVTFYKGQRSDGEEFSEPGGLGYGVDTVSATVGGKGDWTQANPQGYQADQQMPGVAGNTPAPGDGRFQTDGQNGSGHVLYGGWLKGQRPGTSRHPGNSGPGT
jgi:hypothetical protein